MPAKAQRWLPVMILGGAVAVLFYRLLLGEVIYWGVPLLQFGPWREAAFTALRAGRLPLWNPLVGNGAPLLANYQTAVFYPPNWLYLVIPTPQAMGWVGMLHLVWAGLGLAAYLRRLGADRLGQGVGALAYGLSAWIVGRFGFLSIISAYAWLPWLLWVVEGVVVSGSDWGGSQTRPYKWAAALAIVTAMLLLAGHAQTAFYGLVFAGAYAVYRALAGQPIRLAIRRLGMAFGSVVVGVLIAGIQLAPTFELMRASQRAGGVDALAALSYSFWPWRALTFLAPEMFGSPVSGDYWGYGNYWEDAVYVGLLPLLLAVRAVSIRWWGERSRDDDQSPAAQVVPFFAVSLIPVGALALGWNTPLFPWLFRHVPTFNQFNAPTRWLVLAVLALAVLGGIGADNWHVRRSGQRRAALGLVFGIGLAGSALLAAALLADRAEPTFVRGLARLGVTAALCSGLALLLVRADRADLDRSRQTWRTRWEGAALLLVAVDLVVANWGVNPVRPAAYYRQRAALAEVLPPGTRALYLPEAEYEAKFGVFLDFSDFHTGDTARWQALRASLLPNLGMLDGVPSASNFDPLQVGVHTALLERIDALPAEQQVEWLRRLNAGLLLTTAPRSDLVQVGTAGAITAYAVPDPFPRAFVGQCRQDGDVRLCDPAADGEVQIQWNEAEKVEVRVWADQAQTLVLTDTDYPGWEATVDGEPVSIERVNGAFRGVAVPAGAHTVTFVYRPVSLRVGAVLSGLGLAVVVAIGYLASGDSTSQSGESSG